MSVSTLVLLGLAVVWAILLLPEALKRVAKVRSGDSIRSFNRQLSSLQLPAHRTHSGGSNVIDLRSRARAPQRRTAHLGTEHARSGRPAGAPAPVSPAVRRRRQEVLSTLGSASVLSLLCSIAFGGPFLLLFLVAAGLLVAYAVALHQVTNTTSASTLDRRAHPVTSSTRRVADVPGVRVSPVNARRVAN